MPREDSLIIKAFEKIGQSVSHWREIPLIYVEPDSDFLGETVSKIINQHNELVEKYNESKVLTDVAFEAVKTMPLKEFLFYDNLADTSERFSLNPVKTDDEHPSNLVKIHVKNSSSESIETEMHCAMMLKEHKVGIPVIVKVKNVLTRDGLTKANLINAKELITSAKGLKSQEQANDMASYLMDYADKILTLTFCLFYELQKTDLHPVERKSPVYRQVTKKGKAKRKLVGFSRNIVFLNKLPVRYSGHDGEKGHHASPRFHQRRGHKRILRAERFKNHPDYMKEKWIKPMFIGAKEATMKDGTTYKVI